MKKLRFIPVLLSALMVFQLCIYKPVMASGESLVLGGCYATGSALVSAFSALGIINENNIDINPSNCQKLIDDCTAYLKTCNLVQSVKIGAKTVSVLSSACYALAKSAQINTLYLSKSFIDTISSWAIDNGYTETLQATNSYDNITSYSPINTYKLTNSFTYPIIANTGNIYVSDDNARRITISDNSKPVYFVVYSSGTSLLLLSEASFNHTYDIYSGGAWIIASRWSCDTIITTNGINYYASGLTNVNKFTNYGIQSAYNNEVIFDISQLLFNNYDRITVPATKEWYPATNVPTKSAVGDEVDSTGGLAWEKTESFPVSVDGVDSLVDAYPVSVPNSYVGVETYPVAGEETMPWEDIKEWLKGLAGTAEDAKTASQSAVRTGTLTDAQYGTIEKDGTDTKAVENTASADETQGVIGSLVDWGINLINPNTGILSKFPFSITYDAYLIVNSISGGTASSYDVDPNNVTVQTLEAPSGEFEIIGSDINYSGNVDLGFTQFPIELNFDKFTWLFNIVKFGIGVLWLFGLLFFVGGSWSKSNGGDE